MPPTLTAAKAMKSQNLIRDSKRSLWYPQPYRDKTTAAPTPWPTARDENLLIHTGTSAGSTWQINGSNDFYVSFTTGSTASSGTINLNTTTDTNAWITDATNRITIYPNTDDTIVWDSYTGCWDKKSQLRNKIKHQLAPAILNHRGDSPRATRIRGFKNVPQNEIVALHLLRKMVSKDEFKKYLKYGFIGRQGPSGLVYQIQRNQEHIKVWHQGTLLCELCVGLRDRRMMPPTDEVVAKIVIVDCNEIDIWRRANIHWRDALNTFRKIRSNSIQEQHLLQLVA